jgi:hypothetical protein
VRTARAVEVVEAVSRLAHNLTHPPHHTTPPPLRLIHPHPRDPSSSSLSSTSTPAPAPARPGRLSLAEPARRARHGTATLRSDITNVVLFGFDLIFAIAYSSPTLVTPLRVRRRRRSNHHPSPSPLAHHANDSSSIYDDDDLVQYRLAPIKPVDATRYEAALSNFQIRGEPSPTTISTVRPDSRPRPRPGPLQL